MRGALSDCLGREALQPVDLGGRAAILRDARARSPGAVAISAPSPLGILHVVHTPGEARAVVRAARHLRLVRRGRVVYEPAELGGVREVVEACIDEAERAAPVSS